MYILRVLIISIICLSFSGVCTGQGSRRRQRNRQNSRRGNRQGVSIKSFDNLSLVSEKTGLRDFRPGPT